MRVYYLYIGEHFISQHYIYVTLGDQLEERTIKPLYLKDLDIQCSDGDRLTGYDLMDCLTKVVGNSLHGLQLSRIIWRVCLSDHTCTI